MTKQVAKKQSTEVSTEAMDLSQWGEQEVSREDIVIPKILAMQGLSELVTSRKAQIGEFRDSVSAKLLGSIDEPMEFIPFHVQKLWIEFLPDEKGVMKFSKVTPMTRENEGKPWEEKDSTGKAILRRDRTLQFFVLRPDDLKEGLVMPYVLSFRRTSAQAGKKLYTQMYFTNKQRKLPPPAFVMKLTGKIETNNNGTYVVMDVEEGRKVNTEELMAAFEMYKVVQAGETKVDNSEFESNNTNTVSDRF